MMMVANDHQLIRWTEGPLVQTCWMHLGHAPHRESPSRGLPRLDRGVASRVGLTEWDDDRGFADDCSDCLVGLRIQAFEGSRVVRRADRHLNARMQRAVRSRRLVLRLLHPSRKVAMTTAKDAMRPAQFESVGIGVAMRERIVVCGAQRNPYFDAVFNARARRTRPHPDDCGDGPVRSGDERWRPDDHSALLGVQRPAPNAHAMNAATGLPVWDWISFVTLIHNAVNPRQYRGLY